MSLSTGTLFAATQAVSGGMALGNAFAQSTALRAQGRAENAAAQTNAGWLNLQAQDATMRGERESQIQKQKTKQIIAAQRAAQGAQGLDVNADSALGVQEDAAAYGALDALTIRLNAQREAMGLSSKAAAESSRGRMAWLSAKNKAQQSIISGGLAATRDFTYGAYGLSKWNDAHPKKEDPYYGYGDQG